MSLLTTLDHARAGEAAAWGDLFRSLQPQVMRYRPWARTAMEVEALDQALWSALWEALHTHPPKALQPLNERRACDLALVNIKDDQPK